MFPLVPSLAHLLPSGFLAAWVLPGTLTRPWGVVRCAVHYHEVLDIA